MKRFYSEVVVSDALGILLDGRPVRTPARAILTLPTPALALAVAQEWAAQGDQIDPRAMPMTGLANAATDRISADQDDFAAGLACYAETDLVCYRADAPALLARRQAERWDPILDWATARYDVHFVQVTGIMHRPQPPETIARLADEVAIMTAWELAGFAPLVTLSGSLLIPLAILDGAMTAEAAFDIAHLDELWQVEQWGEDSLAEATRAAHRADFMAGSRFIDLVRG